MIAITDQLNPVLTMPKGEVTQTATSAVSSSGLVRVGVTPIVRRTIANETKGYQTQEWQQSDNREALHLYLQSDPLRILSSQNTVEYQPESPVARTPN